ncbi:MAG: hypothetical protein ACFFDF_12975 [Candidatus Odinarchaeota archaeon]
MDLRKEYEKLYQHWLKEFQNIDLTEITQETFNEYKRLLNFINDYREEEKEEVKAQLLKSYKENINYLFKDFLKIRERKIINSAMTLKEINLMDVIEAEKLLYQNLVSSIKGYKKIKAMSLEEEDEIVPGKLMEVKQERKSIIDQTSISKEDKTVEVINTKKKSEKEKINYILVRFLKKTPPLVGVDLINYGPFEEEDIANLPQKNAKILIIEKYAEKIEID